MLTVLHGSDLHFGKPYKPEAGEAFLAAAHRAAPDLVVISGDLTQRAKVREYEQARAFLERLPEVPLVVTPGNHDVPLYRVFERIFTPFRNYRTYIRRELETVTRVDGAVVVSLNSAAPRRAIVNGRIDREQLEFAARAFEEAGPDDARILVAHHHLAPAPDYESDTFIPRAREVLNWCDRMGVEMILGGHLHRAYIGDSLDVYPGEEVDKGIVIVQSGTTTSHRGRARESAKNSFNVIRIARKHLEITHFMYFDDVGGFAPFSMHAFPRRDDLYFAEDPFQTGALILEDGEAGGGDSTGRVP
ncbi:MAG: 3',5'-cyclic-nucleotide phosphodiesterase [Gemmatimonadetes bacterium]|nr:3',5'-cyclic-nucleotide phosphodiesterase [Gemmatimonadota bacterium]NIR78699.1 3',5'-cyclic-nucleotide phosphodiesterase [Gemmatimonadota bacterium]NIT87338.1 3',5'-cyclic-nucleotide phosphodiesterase [Gemmatimonadota bacterium]NIU31182.1 3',5'-cyclic-nucleotide phosphodiesterase [Gemmatimonadota bacterium]NIU35904.1 3',5'-cyclic-nucleotide phosphodiesterase [Gemmatimonadota bacterium]